MWLASLFFYLYLTQWFSIGGNFPLKRKLTLSGEMFHVSQGGATAILWVEATVAANILQCTSEVKWSEVKLLSPVWVFAAPWTVAYQAPPSMGFSRQEYWSGLPFPSPGVFPTQGAKPGLLHCRQTLLPSEPPGKPDGTQNKELSNPICQWCRNWKVLC